MNPFRTALIAGNWKMNAGGRDACALARGVARGVSPMRLVEVVVAPPYTALAAAAYEIEQICGSIETAANEDGKRGVGVAAQNMHARSKGAFTGEVSAPMLRDSGVSWVILGHSERRQFFGETDATVKEKVDAAFAANVRPIVCVGETLEEREAGHTLEVVERQLRAFMTHFLREPGFGVVAYEPVWAIGTGRVASPEDAQQVHARIREVLGEVSEEVAALTRILYGGSVKGDNAEGLLGQEDIDGALVGGASLEVAGFVQIVAAAQKLAEQLAEEAGTEPEEPTADPPEPPTSEKRQQELSFENENEPEPLAQELPANEGPTDEPSDPAASVDPPHAEPPLDIPSGSSETF
ncbi:MAG: triose-phosphate isomerase [Polyangiaceae bacterium]